MRNLMLWTGLSVLLAGCASNSESSGHTCSIPVAVGSNLADEISHSKRTPMCRYFSNDKGEMAVLYNFSGKIPPSNSKYYGGEPYAPQLLIYALSYKGSISSFPDVKFDDPSDLGLAVKTMPENANVMIGGMPEQAAFWRLDDTTSKETASCVFADGKTHSGLLRIVICRKAGDPADDARTLAFARRIAAEDFHELSF